MKTIFLPIQNRAIKKILLQPKILYRYFRQKGWRRFFVENILESKGSNKNKALSISLGLLIGVTPFYGFHAFIVFFLASIFRLNKVISFLFTRISIPPLFPFVVATALSIGSPFVNSPTTITAEQFSFSFFKNHFYQYIIGTTILGISLSICGGGLAFLLLEIRSRKKV
ncbi:MAG: DUF2062 domain-containing protein [Bacteroidetes bacterium]|nr:DUF2062 domain-containing protein [Bacteroidota bacterium]